MDTFVLAAHEWHSLLRDVGSAFVAQHLDSSMQLAVALHCQDDADAARSVDGLAGSEQQSFITLSTILRRLVEAATREHMTFLLPTADNMETETSTALKLELTKRQKVLQSLPEAFTSRFRQLLEMHWNKLIAAAERTTSSLPRVQQLNYQVATDKDTGVKQIMLRLQTSDGRTRTIHVPLKQFHQLRHSAATVLQEMNQVEAHPMMRLAYMQQSRLEPTSSLP